MSGRRLRIAHVLPWPGVGGSELGVLRLARSLDREKYESIAYCVQKGEAVRELFHTAGYETAEYQSAEPSFRHPLPYLSATRDLARSFKRLGVDVVHCADLLAAYHAGLAGRLAGAYVLSHVRCAYPTISRRDRQFLRPVQRWVFVSRSTWDEFALPVPATRAVVLPDAAVGPPSSTADSPWTGDGIPVAARIIGMVSRVAPIKDFETLAQAAVEVVRAQPDAHFVIVGDHSGADSYRVHYAHVDKLLRDLGVRDHFHFTGYVRDVRRIVERFEVAVLVTRSEGLPLSLLECMSLGKPVVATAVGGVPEVVHQGENGFLHRRGDAAGLASALLTLLSDSDLRVRMGQNAARSAREQHGEDRFAERVEALYASVVASRESKATARFRGIQRHRSEAVPPAA